MIQRRIRQNYQITDIQYVDGTPGPLRVGMALDVHSRGLTNREYIRRSLEETLKKPVATFEYAVVEKEEVVE